MAHRQFFRFRSRPLGAVVAAAAALPLVGIGQELDLGALRELDDDRTDITYRDLTVEQLEDMNVVRESTLVGEIDEVLIDERERIVAVVIEAASPSPGRREREIVVPIDRIEFDAEALLASTDLTEAEIDALPEWDDD